jgi:hypothetical protein
VDTTGIYFLDVSFGLEPTVCFYHDFPVCGESLVDWVWVDRLLNQAGIVFGFHDRDLVHESEGN